MLKYWKFLLEKGVFRKKLIKNWSMEIFESRPKAKKPVISERRDLFSLSFQWNRECLMDLNGFQKSGKDTFDRMKDAGLPEK